MKNGGFAQCNFYKNSRGNLVFRLRGNILSAGLSVLLLIMNNLRLGPTYKVDFFYNLYVSLKEKSSKKSSLEVIDIKYILLKNKKPFANSKKYFLKNSN